jgi:hypothetical protein
MGPNRTRNFFPMHVSESNCMLKLAQIHGLLPCIGVGCISTHKVSTSGEKPKDVKSSMAKLAKFSFRRNFPKFDATRKKPNFESKRNSSFLGKKMQKKSKNMLNWLFPSNHCPKCGKFFKNFAFFKFKIDFLKIGSKFFPIDDGIRRATLEFAKKPCFIEMYRSICGLTC